MVSTSQTARDSVFQPLQVEGAVERIVRRLGEAIGSGVLRPGERLPPELELAEMLDVAPMTLRQALAILRDAGYVETRRGRGAGSFVADDVARPLGLGGRVPTEAELVDLIDWRRAISGEAAHLAAERGDAARLDEILVPRRLPGDSEDRGLVPLSQLVRLERAAGPGSIDRLNRQRQVTLYANLAPGD